MSEGESRRGFPDHFSDVAGAYADFRPQLPEKLARLIAEEAPGRDLAVDVGCGSGQFTGLLARHFDRIVGCDASRAQIDKAFPHRGVAYHVAPAEDLPLHDRTADALVAAQAAHWFDHARFPTEAARVMRPGGLIAYLTYQTVRVEGAAGGAFDEVYEASIKPHWPAERAHVEDGYARLPFPFEEIPAPDPPLTHEALWSRARLLGYCATWSAVGAARAAGEDPIPALEAALAPHWPEDKEKRLAWPIAMRLGRAP